MVTLEEWIAALRSGKYKQGRAALRNADDTYCCMGVLCDLYNADAWSMTSPMRPFYWRSGSLAYAPNEIVRETLGVRDFATADRVQGQLAQMNDNVTSFLVIAEYLESGEWKTLEGPRAHHGLLHNITMPWETD